MKPKKAAILAAGRGVRLDRLNSPKPLVKVGGKPLIFWIIKHLEEAGVMDITIMVGERAREIKHALTEHQEIKATLKFIEGQAGTAANLAQAVAALDEHFNEPFYLTMADLVFERNPFPNFSGTEPQALVDAHIERALRSGARSRAITDSEGRIISAGHNLNEGALQTGVYMLDNHFLHWLNSAGAQLESFDDALVQYGAERPVTAVELSDGDWHDVNTPAIHVRAELLARKLLNKGAQQSASQGAQRSLDIIHTFTRNRTLQTHIVVEQGILEQLSERELIPAQHARSNHYLITDATVDALYGNQVQKGLSAQGAVVHKIVVQPGESTKNINIYARIADEIFSRGLDKHSIIISLGGGVVNNIAGFLASTLYRGIGLIHIPTTSMAQVDAAIDFKQAVNASFGKNLFGSYYAAQTIIIDPKVLLSLPQRNLYDGFSESIKHALTQDPDFLKYLSENSTCMHDVNVLEEIVRRTLALKVPLLSGDITDDYNEMIPQYGHSVAHAIEHLSGYELYHGEAVSVGMCVVAEISHLMGMASKETVDAHYKICEQYRLPTQVPADISPEDVCTTIRYDKHYLWGSPHMSLVIEFGKCWEENKTYGLPVDYELVKQAVAANQSRNI
jgi:3-dehydroquinate synthase